jgi:DNA polymerase-3 subunit alpha
MSFVHLHVRSAYSFLQGTIQIRELVTRTRELGMPAVALTDLGQMFGTWKFYREAVRAGIKPILGVEAFVAPKDRRTHATGEDPGTLVLLASDLTGYRNLTRLVARANMEGYFHHPRVDMELLKEHSEGLIALSSGMSGEILRLLLMDRQDLAAERARAYAKLFSGRFYLELQANGLSWQAKANDSLAALGKALGLPLVAASETRYLNKEDHGAYEVLQCIRTRKVLNFEWARDQGSQGEFYFKGPTEMRLEFAAFPEALANTLSIASRCHVDFPEKRLFASPRPDIGISGASPDDFQSRADDYFLKRCREGLEKFLQEMEGGQPPLDPDLPAIYQTRLRKEASDII